MVQMSWSEAGLMSCFAIRMCEAASPPIGKVVFKGYWRAKVRRMTVVISRPVTDRMYLLIVLPGDMGSILH